ncbi:MAG: HDOD domain-containing protein [Piscirickettsiaceae bacterium]|nr:HDOD domain-containing protein [Piscirickettsiaceae bacterium]
MADQAPFELLKTFSGLIHRRPLFITDRLDVDSYHLTFLDKQGQKLNDDSEIPDFLKQLPTILPAINDRQKALLSIPESWRDTILNSQDSSQKLIIDINGDTPPDDIDSSRFSFASHADKSSNDSNSAILLIDLEHHDQQSLTEHLPHWREHHTTLCATNVNNLDDFTLCKSQTLDLLQGQFYTLPSAKDNQKISPSIQILMELLVKLQNPTIEPEDLAASINQDISLSYKLLRLINSAFFGLPREVNSTKQAIVMLGHTKIKTWASLLCLSGVDDKPVELRIVAMTRARMCELLAKYYKGQPEMFFAAGLFSTLDALMDSPLEILIKKLPLAPDLKEALLDHSGAAGSALRDVLNYEKGDWAAIETSPIPVEVLARAYLDAIHWAKELNTQLQD